MPPAKSVENTVVAPAVDHSASDSTIEPRKTGSFMPAYLLAWDGGQQHAASRPRSTFAPIRARRWGQRTAWSPPALTTLPPRRPATPATLAPPGPAHFLYSARTPAPHF